MVGFLYLAMAVPDARAWIQSIDDQVLTMAVDGETGSLVDVAKAITFIGSTAIMFPFVMFLAAYLYWKKRRISTLFWLSALAVAEVLIWVSKFIYARPRPPLALVPTHGDSFPSGHAGTAAAVAVGVVLLLAILESRHWYLDAVAVLCIVAMAWSRVYLRAHWLSDVVAGAALGAAVAISVYLVFSLLVERGGTLAIDSPNARA